MMKRLFHILTIVLAVLPLCAHADEPNSVIDSVEVHFKQSRIELLPNFSRNREAINRITDSLSFRYADSLRWQLNRVHVVGAASPEGSVRFNRWLSERRAGAIYDYLSKTFGFTPPNRSKRMNSVAATGVDCSRSLRATALCLIATRCLPWCVR